MLPCLFPAKSSTWAEESLDSHGPCMELLAKCSHRCTEANKVQALHLGHKEVMSGMQELLVDWQSHRRDKSKEIQI